MTHSCVFAPGKCIVFPNQKRVLVIPSVAFSAGNLVLGNMVNGMYLNPLSMYINLTVFSSSTIDFYNTFHNNLTTIQTNYFAGTPTKMIITPTQSPNLFLRNYMNTATFEIYGLYTDPYIKAFYLNAPSDVVTWDTTYCNATLTSPGNNPYPTRLICQYLNETAVSIVIPQGVSYQTGVTDNYILTVNAKFKIKDFSVGQDILYVSTPITSGTFNAYGSYSILADDYHFYITEAFNTINISQLQVPPIGEIEFVTESYK